MPEAEQILEKKYVATLTTNSLKEILKLFPYDEENPKFTITKLRARASKGEKDTPLIDDPVFGIIGYLDKRSDSFHMDYIVKFDDNGKNQNPVDRTAIDSILNNLHRLGLEDAAVEEIHIMIRDKELGNAAGIDEELFSMALISDPVDSDLDRQKVQEHQVNKNLVKESGFKYRILHCKWLIDRKQELTKPKSQQIPMVQWEGDTFYSLRSSVKVVQKVRDYFRPYNLIKAYGAGQEDTLILLDVSR